MADKEISALTAASSAVGTDELVLNQDAGGGAFVTKRITVSAFKSGLFESPGAIGSSTPGTIAGTTGAFSDVLAVSKSANSGLHLVTVANANAGTNAWAGIGLGNGSGAVRGGVVLWGSGWTTSGTARQDGTYIFGGGAGGLTLATNANQPIYFDQNGGEAGRIDANRYWLFGYTSSQGSYKLQVAGDAIVATLKNVGTFTERGTVSGASTHTWYTIGNYGSNRGIFLFGADTGSGHWSVATGFMYSGAAIVTIASGGVPPEWQVSGTNLQVRQVSGGTANINWCFQKFSSL